MLDGVALAPGERSVLKSICDTIVPSLPGDAFYARGASDLGVDSLLAQVVEESMQPSNANDFRRILSVVESPLYNLLLTGRPVRFSSLGERERERYLASWRDSRIPLKRTAFQALKRLTCFLAYASSGESGENPNWSDIGYPGPSHDPPTPTPESLRLASVPIDKDLTMECDVVILGSGAGGGVMAEVLSTAGLGVLVLEQGPNESSETFKQNEMRMMQKLFQQSGTASTKDLSFLLLAGRGAGGGTTVNWNTCLRTPLRILKEWETEYGLTGLTGPEFGSYQEEIWRAIGVNASESQRNPNNQVLWEGCRALGYTEGTDYEIIQRNAVGCHERCDFCTYGCIYACKQSTALTYLPSAQNHGARFVFDTRAEQIVIEGGAARGVVAVHRANGHSNRIDVKARAVVAACGSIETPALLLRSGVRERNVGRFLRLHPTVPIFGVFERPIDPWKGPPQTVVVRKFIDLDGTYHGFWTEAAPAHPGLYALVTPWEGGRQHKDFMRKVYAHSSATIILLRERSSGRVSIDGDGYPEVSYDLEGADKNTLIRGMEETAKILAAAGANGLYTTHNHPVFAEGKGRSLSPSDLDNFSAQLRKRGISYNRLLLGSAHIMGSCRMTADPSAGPTSPSGELHSVRNLFIGDASVFPTSPGVNPMVSIMAMARRTAESIKTALGRRA